MFNYKILELLHFNSTIHFLFLFVHTQNCSEVTSFLCIRIIHSGAMGT